ncbi:MAG: hypothetical protein KAI71_05110 [Candidatus Pacebacteria bacterium]|nr:hypothetical protein [Candidatus Paceibacterota bacterium]
MKNIVKIKARFSKKDLRVVIKDDDPEDEVGPEDEAEVEAEVEAIVEVEVEVEVEKASNDNDWKIVVEPSKTTIKILRPTPAGARLMANELNKLPEIKGVSQWSMNQKGSEISILGSIKEENIKIFIEPLAVEIIVQHCGDKE